MHRLLPRTEHARDCGTSVSHRASTGKAAADARLYECIVGPADSTTRRHAARMLSACEVLVATDARDLSDSLVNELRQRGALVVSIEEAEAVAEVLDGGVRPDVLVVDGVLPDGDGIVHRIRAALRAPSLPVVTICPATAESPPVPGTHLAQRSVSDVVDLLDEVAQPRSAFRPGDFTLNP